MTVGDRIVETFTPRRPAPQPRHVRLGPAFIEKNLGDAGPPRPGLGTTPVA